MPINVPELEKHINSLCTTHSITIVPRASGGGRSYAKTRTIHIKTIKSMITYFVALHEVGHIVHPKGHGTNLVRLEKEYYAWEWALENSQVDPNDAAKKLIHRCLTSYTNKAKRSPRMKLPPIEHPLWMMIAQMEME